MGWQQDMEWLVARGWRAEKERRAFVSPDGWRIIACRRGSRVRASEATSYRVRRPNGAWVRYDAYFAREGARPRVRWFTSLRGAAEMAVRWGAKEMVACQESRCAS